MKNNFLQEAYGGLTEARSKHYCLGLPRKWKVMTSTLLLLFTFAIGNVWGTIPTNTSQLTTFTCGTTAPTFSYVYTFESVGTNTDTIVFSAALLYGSNDKYAYTGSTSSRTSSDSNFPATLYNEASGKNATNGKGIYSSGSGSNCSRLNINNTTKNIRIKVTNCVAVKISAHSNDADNAVVLNA